MTRLLSHALSLLFVVVTSCAQSPAATQAPSRRPAASSGTDGPPEHAAFDRAHHMQASLWLAMTAREALSNGDLDGAKSAGSALAEHDYEATIPESWSSSITELQVRAAQLARARDIDEASQALAAVALVCGHCHYRANAGPEPRHDPPVEWRPGPDALDERMGRHSQGASQLWIGLLEPSNEAWRSGTLTLMHAPLGPPHTVQGSVDTHSAQAIERVRWLARRARSAASYAERGQIYAQILATCGRCHGTISEQE